MESISKLMFCKTCSVYNISNSMATKGSSNLHISTIKLMKVVQSIKMVQEDAFKETQL